MKKLWVLALTLYRRTFLLRFKIFHSRKIDKTWGKATINSFNRSGESISCPYCSSSKSSVYYRAPLDGDSAGIFDKDLKRLDILYGIHIKNAVDRSLYFEAVKKIIIEKKTLVDYLKCPGCGLIYQNYPHEQKFLDNYYNKLYRSMYADGAYGRGMEEKFVQRKSLIAKYFLNKTGLAPSSKILDIGCAEGIVCHSLREAGMIPYGIDPCLQEVEYAREYFKLDNVLFGNYEPDSYPPASFDGIISHHVLEHMLHIRESFEAMRRHLRPEGYLLIRCPQIAEEKTRGKKGLNGGLHLAGFTREFLVKALSGFELLEVLETPHEVAADFTWVHIDEPVSPWGDTSGSISILCRRLTDRVGSENETALNQPSQSSWSF